MVVFTVTVSGAVPVNVPDTSIGVSSVSSSNRGSRSQPSAPRRTRVRRCRSRSSRRRRRARAGHRGAAEVALERREVGDRRARRRPLSTAGDEPARKKSSSNVPGIASTPAASAPTTPPGRRSRYWERSPVPSRYPWASWFPLRDRRPRSARARPSPLRLPQIRLCAERGICVRERREQPGEARAATP